MGLTNRSTMAQVTLALAVLLSTTVAPVAAAPDEGGLLGGDDGGLLGGANESEAGSNATDVVDDTVDTTTGQVDDATGTDAVGDAVDSATAPVAGVTDGTAPTDGVTEGGAGPAGTVSDAVTSTGEATDADATTADAAAEPLAGDRLERGVGTGLLPVGPLPTDRLPVTGEGAPVEPEDSPYGSDASGRLDACTLPVRSDDLPLERAPAPSDLPVELDVPGVPASLLTPETVTGLAFAVAPRPCTVYDPHDPSIDPTEPPNDPEAVAELSQVEAGQDGVQVAGGSLAFLERGGPSSSLLAGIVANREQISAGERLKATDGRTSKYLYLKGLGLVLVEERVVDGQLETAVFGKSFTVTSRCELQNASAPSADDPLGPCEYDYNGLPQAVTAEDVIDMVQNPPSEPPVQPQGDVVP